MSRAIAATTDAPPSIPGFGAEQPSNATAPPETKAAKVDGLFHLIWLVLPAAALGLSVVLEIRDSRQVIVPVINRPLPELCMFRRMVGIDCAGCGLTRCFISIGHGRLADAWNYHPAGFLIYAMAAFQIPWRSVQLWRLSRGQSELRLGKSANPLIFAMAVVLLGEWVFRIWGQILG
jgi:hypothetical protein